MRTLLIDNYDSYTYNLFQLLAGVYGTEPTVIRNDEPGWSLSDLDLFDAVVISPGPGHPASERDFGHSRQALRQSAVPVLGVCLGHQGIGLESGARVTAAPTPRHGHLTQITHTGTGLFSGLPQGFTAVRYHSLCVSQPLPASLEAVAWSEDGVIMALRRRDRPQWGVQFHPESVSTEYGAQLLTNFRAVANPALTVPPGRARNASALPGTARKTNAPGRTSSGPALRACVRCLDWAADAERVFTALYSTSGEAFWLDSSRVEHGLSRFSFLGDASGPDGEVLTFRLADGSVQVTPARGVSYREPGTIFDALARRLGSTVAGADDLPFDLCGGYVGYFGYELKACVGAANAHQARTPDAVWLRASRLIAIDHLENRTYVVAITSPDDAPEAQAWTDQTAAVLRSLRAEEPVSSVLPEPGSADVAQWLTRPRSQYLDDIAECQQQLRAGESYEICLTNTLRLPAPDDDLEYYRRLRRLNPAPYSALLRSGRLAVFSSSPECFLRIHRDRLVESKPIKGTAPRDPDPVVDEQLRRTLQSDPKTRAENLMIVDLLRNDLGRVCSVGNVTVPAFMVTESYATVHQLSSTIHGTLRDDVTAIDCVRACFPGGSMTGAPKLRTLEIIDSLEESARGVYSGALGYLAHSGCADLSIVIRTAVRWDGELTVGAGGAIVLDSDALAEHDEMLLKARAPLRALPPRASTAPRTKTGRD